MQRGAKDIVLQAAGTPRNIERAPGKAGAAVDWDHEFLGKSLTEIAFLKIKQYPQASVVLF
ncbi:hypothetical protein [Novacetimonas hansenii]|uniref:Uncharacterized protein n=1 Tax=Novacetimonas hansenii TaxID=436 RepID=A0AAW5ERU6_NOVHA|nr:hypothetical protein [Novacetimonas hansenii]MCJ8353452.1 hypothetical protein [Novacetimonas hansenii]